MPIQTNWAFSLIAVLSITAATLSTSLFAEDEEPIVLPGSSEEPVVTIRHGKTQSIYEYRIRGNLYAVRVVPKVGKSYYLVSPNGSGKFIREDRDDFLIPQWVLLEW